MCQSQRESRPQGRVVGRASRKPHYWCGVLPALLVLIVSLLSSTTVPAQAQVVSLSANTAPSGNFAYDYLSPSGSSLSGTSSAQPYANFTNFLTTTIYSGSANIILVNGPDSTGTAQPTKVYYDASTYKVDTVNPPVNNSGQVTLTSGTTYYVSVAGSSSIYYFSLSTVAVANPGSLPAFSVYLAGSPAPTVTNVSPNSGSPSGGASVIITGTNFTGATGVTIGGIAATNVTVTSSTSITVTTPAGTAGTASVLVTTPGGANAANSLYTYKAAAPTIAAISPNFGPVGGGQTVTITGTNFTAHRQSRLAQCRQPLQSLTPQRSLQPHPLGQPALTLPLARMSKS